MLRSNSNSTVLVAESVSCNQKTVWITIFGGNKSRPLVEIDCGHVLDGGIGLHKFDDLWISLLEALVLDVSVFQDTISISILGNNNFNFF